MNTFYRVTQRNKAGVVISAETVELRPGENSNQSLARILRARINDRNLIVRPGDTFTLEEIQS